MYYYFTCTVIIATGIFDSRIIFMSGGSVKYHRVIHVLLLLPVFSLICIAFGAFQLGLMINAIVVCVVYIAISYYAIALKPSSNDQMLSFMVWTIRVGAISSALSVVIPILMYFGFIVFPSYLLHAILIQSYIASIVLIFIITARGRRQELLTQQERVLAQVNAMQLQTEVERRIEKERFISMLTHELRNPLSVIQLLSGNEHPNAASLRRAALDMAHVIARVEQSEGGRLTVDKSLFDVAELINEILEERGDTRHVSLDFPVLPQLRTDRLLLRHTFENLIDNAIKYRASGSVVRVAMRPSHYKDAQGMTFTVANELGAAGEPDPERLFTKYYRNSRAGRHPGSGLGMFLVAGWVHALGGTITYSKTGGVGASREANFTVWLPM